MVKESGAVTAYKQDDIGDIKIEERKVAAEIDSVGKYEPKLTENGIPADVLAKLLPGDDVLELIEPKVGGGLGYRFVKRAFDVVSCGCALIVLAVPHGNHRRENQAREPRACHLLAEACRQER